jgi:stage V sporulation protein B
VLKSILSISTPVALTSYVRSALLSIEHSLIPKGLRKFGGDNGSALSSYGTLTGMALPVINFPYAIIGSFTSLLVPEVSESRAKGEKRHVGYITYRTYQSCLAFAFCVAGIFFAFADRLGLLLYSSSEAAKYIRLLSLLVPVMYADTSTDAILKGLGEQVHCMKVNIADSLLSVALVCFLVPKLGIVGYVITIYIAELFNAALSIARLIKITDFRFPIRKTVLFPLFSAIGAGSVCNLVLYVFALPEGLLSLILAIVIFVLLYFIFISVTGTVSDEDAIWIRNVFGK